MTDWQSLRTAVFVGFSRSLCAKCVPEFRDFDGSVEVYQNPSFQHRQPTLKRRHLRVSCTPHQNYSFRAQKYLPRPHGSELEKRRDFDPIPDKAQPRRAWRLPLSTRFRAMSWDAVAEIVKGQEIQSPVISEMLVSTPLQASQAPTQRRGICSNCSP